MVQLPGKEKKREVLKLSKASRKSHSDFWEKYKIVINGSIFVLICLYVFVSHVSS